MFIRERLARAGLAAACLASVLLFTPATHAAATQIGAPANVMLHVGSHGQRVKDLQWLLGNHSPNVFRSSKVRPTFTGKPNGLLGERTGKAIVTYKWQLGYPTRMLKTPLAGPYFFELLTGKAQRPIAWVARASKRYSDPETQPTALALKIRTLELSQLGVSESPLGSNRGSLVYTYQRVTGAIGLAWCVSFQQWGFKTAGAGVFAYATAGVYVAVDWAHPRGLLRSRPKVGALVAFVDYDRYGHRIPGTGHMGYVVKVTVSGFVSVEGNAANRVLERYHANNERPHVFIYLKGVAQ
jgi:hypothetical protein